MGYGNDASPGNGLPADPGQVRVQRMSLNSLERRHIRGDPQKYLRAKDGIAVIACQEPMRFKYEIDSGADSVFAVIDVGQKGAIRTRKPAPTFFSQYFVSGSVFDVFNSLLFPYLELELHGPITTRDPGKSVTFNEIATLIYLEFSANNSDIVQN